MGKHMQSKRCIAWEILFEYLNFLQIWFAKMQNWAHRSLKSLFRSSLLSEPWFWEQWRSLRQRAKRSERTDKIKFLAVRSWAI